MDQSQTKLNILQGAIVLNLVYDPEMNDKFQFLGASEKILILILVIQHSARFFFFPKLQEFEFWAGL